MKGRRFLGNRHRAGNLVVLIPVLFLDERVWRGEGVLEQEVGPFLLLKRRRFVIVGRYKNLDLAVLDGEEARVERSTLRAVVAL